MFIGILIFVIISETYIRKYRKKEGKEAGKKDIGHKKLKKKGYKKERVNKKISYVVLYVKCLLLCVGTLQ